MKNQKSKLQIQINLNRETIDKINRLAVDKGISTDDLYQEACNNLLNDRQLLNGLEASEYLGITRVTLWRKVQAGKIPTVDIGGHVRYDKRQLDKIIST